jgi:hypothetical protein
MNATLPELTGSPKQIEWASQIRNEAMVKAIATVATRAIKALYDAGHSQIGDMVDVASGKVLSQTSASWWIEHRPKTDGAKAGKLDPFAEARILDQLTEDGATDEQADLVRDAFYGDL